MLFLWSRRATGCRWMEFDLSHPDTQSARTGKRLKCKGLLNVGKVVVKHSACQSALVDSQMITQNNVYCHLLHVDDNDIYLIISSYLQYIE